MVKLEKQTLQHLLNQCAEDYSDKTAVAFVEGEEITYGEFNNRVKNISHFLKEKGIEYTDYNVAEDEAKRTEMIEKSGQMGVPVIDINGKIMVGFDPKAMEAALEGS
jgi:glutaredoxin